jgi:mevalonate kinase
MDASRRTLSQSPAKLIVSGEHAVVCGAPALSLCLDLPTLCHLMFSPLQQRESSTLTLDLPALGVYQTFDFIQWQRIATDVAARYRLYQNNHLAVDRVLGAPWELAVMVFQTFHKHCRLKPGHWQCRVEQAEASPLDLMGKGLGSSAAMTVAMLKGLFCHHHLSEDDMKLLTLAQEVEHFQHGHSSGLDPATIIHGGLVRFEPHKAPTALPDKPFEGWLVDTGTPASATGQVVEAVQRRFGHKHPIWQDFKRITDQATQAWVDQDDVALNQALNANETLLEQLGVVPASIQDFIAQLHQRLDTATCPAGIKLCGAGAINGERGGILLVHHPKMDQALCEAFGYQAFPIRPAQAGAQCHDLNEGNDAI